MISVRFQDAVEESWLTVPVIRLGDSSFASAAPATFITVSISGQPRLRIDVYGAEEPECCAFQEAIAWHRFVAVGFGERLYLVAIDDGVVKTIKLGSYFGHLYPSTDCLLVACGERLTRIDQTGRVVWATETLGIDGVLISDVVGNTIYGRGEWDPPGGWEPFIVDLDTGRRIPEG